MLVHVTVADETVQLRPVINHLADGSQEGMEIGIVNSLFLLLLNESDKIGNIYLTVDVNFVFISFRLEVDAALHQGRNIYSSGILSHGNILLSQMNNALILTHIRGK